MRWFEPMKKAVRYLLLLPVCLVLVICLRAMLLTSLQIPAPARRHQLPTADADAAVQRLASAVRIPTVSGESTHFEALHMLLRSSFPTVFAQLQVETVAEHSLLLHWPGSDPALDPILLMSHLDVVPVEPGTEADWTHPPFGGVVEQGYLWGRGAMDDKLGVLACLEAVGLLLAEGFEPRRGIWLAFGHDEERGGNEGARQIAAAFAARDIRFESVIDEGLPIAKPGMVPGLSGAVALVGIGEKGYLSLELTVEGAGGHSSCPPPETSIAILGRALAQLADHPMPARLDGAAAAMVDTLAPEMDFAERIAFANLWCFDGLVLGQLEAIPPANALVRTTAAATLIEGGVQDNVLPQNARAVVNFRILPGDTIERVIAHAENAIGDPRVRVQKLPGDNCDPPPLTSTAAPAYLRMVRTLRQSFPDAWVAPSLVTGATDSRHFVELSDSILRVLPVRVELSDAPRVHGTDERVAVESYRELIDFFAHWVANSCGAEEQVD